MRVRISVDPDACGCSGFCVRIAPEIFSLAEGGPARVVLAAADPEPALVQVAREAANVCPTGAIRVLEPGDAWA